MRKSVFAAALFFAASAHAAITGTLMTPDGVGIAGGRVTALAQETGDARMARVLSGGAANDPIATSASDARGRFAIDVPKEHPVVTLRIDVAGRAPYEASVARDQELGAIALREARAGRGRVTAGPEPVAGAKVIVSGAFLYVTRTDGNGRYEIPDIDRARIAVAHPDYAIVETLPVEPSWTANLDHTLDGGSPLSGNAVAEDGSPVAGATILLDGWPLATTGEDGSFTIPHAPRNWKTLVASTATLSAQLSFAGAGVQTLRMRKLATISGRVTDATNGAGIGGAVVLTAPPAGATRAITPAAITDANGNYTLRVMPGVQSVYVSHPLYAVDSTKASVGQEGRETVDIRPRPLSLVTGSVVEDGKRPVAAASIFIEDPARRGWRRFGIRHAVSAPDGSFVARYFVNDPKIRVRAVKRGGPSGVSEIFATSAGDIRRGVSIVIPEGVAVSGRVTDPDGNPLAGVKVAAIESDDHPARRGMRAPFEAGEEGVTSAADGTFTLRITEGTFDFSFVRDGYAPKRLFAQKVSRGSPPPLEVKLDPGLEISGRVVREGAGVAGVNISTDGARTTTNAAGEFSLSGLSRGSFDLFVSKPNEFIHDNRVIEAPARDVVFEVGPGRVVAGRVIDRKSETPITAFSVGIARSVSTGGGGSRGTTFTLPFSSEAGAFRFENVPAGAITIVADAPGYASGSKDVTLDSDRDLTDLVIELDHGIRITGRVTDDEGRPVGEVFVSALLGQQLSGHARSSSTQTRPNGEYTLEGVDPASDAITFERDGYLRTAKPLEAAGREIRMDVQLSAGERITGSVVTESGAPVADALVSIFMNGPSESGRTDANGRFEISGLAPGRYIVEAGKRGLTTTRLRDVDISDGKPIRITMKQGGTIAGRITGLPASVLPNVTVSAFGGEAHAETAVDADGNYRLEGAPTGRVTVSASLRQAFTTRSSERKLLEVAAGNTHALDLAFVEGSTIRGRVTRGNAPLAKAFVVFSGDGGHLTTTTGDDGAYELSGLVAGEYGVVVTRGPRQEFHTRYRVSGTATFDIAYPAAGVRGRVIDASTGEPLPNVRVVLQANDPSLLPTGRFGPVSVSSDNSGSFAIDAVPAGKYVLLASREDFGSEAIDLIVGASPIDDVEVRLGRSAGVSLEVIDGRNGHKVRAWVTVYDARGRVVYQGSSGQSADLPLKLPLAPGSYAADVHSPGYAARNITFSSPSNQTVAITPGGTLVIRTTNPGNRAVRLLDSNGRNYPRQTATSLITLPRPPGAATLRNIASGTYTVEVLSEGGAVVLSKQVVVQEGSTTTIDW